jgi:hypothetical protein
METHQARMTTEAADDDADRTLTLHFEGVLTRGHTLPAPALVKSLQEFQRVVHLMAMQAEGREVRQRARRTREIERLYPLVCRIPEEGGYALPVEIGRAGDKLFDAEAVSAVAHGVRRVIEAVGAGDEGKLIEAVPDSYYRKSVLKAFKAMQPPGHSGLVLHIEDFRGHRLLDGVSAADRVAKLLAEPVSDPVGAPGYVAGHLAKMGFLERRLQLQLPGTGRALDATYRDDFEPVLLEHPRELIQIHGNVVHDDDGRVMSISDVDEILEVDDSALVVNTIHPGDRPLRARVPLVCEVKFDPEAQAYEAEGPFDIALSAPTRPELERDLEAELVMLWREYAMADEAALTPAAKRLRAELLATFEEDGDAA